MKKLIGILLALVLALSGILGSVTVVGAESANQVTAHFNSEWIYLPSGDTFVNHEVTGFQHWHANMENLPDETGNPVTAVALTLASEWEFGDVNPEPVTPGPPTYGWSFGDIPEGSGAQAWVGLKIAPELDPFPVTYTPGFDASRSVDQTLFSEPGTQTLTITLTPQDVTEGLTIDIHANEDVLVNPVITSPSSGDGVWLSSDGHRLGIYPKGLELGTTYTYIVTIQVTPKVSKVDFMPFVGINRYEFRASGITSGSSVSHPVGDPEDKIGTWTWNAEGIYEWHWQEGVTPSVHWHFWSRVNRVKVCPGTTWTYDVSGDTFINDEVTGREMWGTALRNWYDETGAPVTKLALSLNSELEFDYFLTYSIAGFCPATLTQMGPPNYEWFIGDVPEGFATAAGVGSKPVTFTPGFDASRSVDKTEFLQSDGTQTQTLTIMLTPRETTELIIMIMAMENDLVDPVITPPSGVDFWLSADGHVLGIDPAGLELGTTYTYIVTIQVTPKVPQAEFMPRVEIQQSEEDLTPRAGIGDSFSYSVPGMGTWTWSAEGSYEWHLVEMFTKSVVFPGYPIIPPIAQASVDTYLAPTGSLFTFDGSASYDPDGTIASYYWDFGDGSRGSGSSVTHSYITAGIYNVVLTITDDIGAQSTDSVMVVVYDPEAGFVTGGGWINSPAGAYTANPTLIGKASFGFVSKYQKGATVPTGQTEFQFRVANLNFHSDSYQWLVISGPHAKFKGSGTINGEGDYGFMLTATDGQIKGGGDVDKFRIKIWDKASGAIIYDNKMGASDTGDDATELSGGSIVIHAKK